MIDYDQTVDSNTAVAVGSVYTYEYIISNSAVAAHIKQPKRLNQVAFLMNNVVVGATVATPDQQNWWGVKYYGCTIISAADLQAVIWALLKAPNECDVQNGGNLCSNIGSTPTMCNVAYLWNFAFANVDDGANYFVPYLYAFQPVVYPIVLVTSKDQSTQIQMIVAVDINSWGINPRCLNGTCVNFFKQGYPTQSPSFTITGGNQALAYVYATVKIAGITHQNQPTFCVDYDQEVSPGNLYTGSPAYSYEYVLANTSIATHIDRPQHLNQIAYLLNNIVIGTSVATPSSQLWWNKNYTGCKTITSQDFQAAVWALVQKQGECDMMPLPENNYTGKICTNTISAPTMCNVAYLWNLAFANVPNGTNYTVTASYSPHPVIYPVIFSPTLTQTSQILLVAVDINTWGISPQCCITGGYYYVAGSTAPTPCRAGYYCPNASTPSQPVAPIKCPAGYYCPTGTCVPTVCPCGYKCPAGAAAPTQCLPPYYCPAQGSTKQTLCPMGYMCPSPGMCAPTQCPPGTFVSCPGKVSCSPCPAGRFCPSVTNQSVICRAGYYCKAASSAATICPPGSWCPLGTSAPIPCPPGSYLPRNGSVSGAACLACSAGTYQSQAGGSACARCPNGTYQGVINATACAACKAGSYQSQPGALDSSACVACGTGTYSAAGASTCTLCAIATYQNQSNSSGCLVCRAGAYQNVTGSSACVSCNAGSYLSKTGGSVCAVCAIGSFQNQTSSSVCLLCSTGAYQNVTGSSACVSCDAGSYSSKVGANLCALCLKGTFQNQTSSSICKVCASATLPGATTCGTNRRLLSQEPTTLDDTLLEKVEKVPASGMTAFYSAGYSLFTMAVLVVSALSVRRVVKSSGLSNAGTK